MKEKNYRQEIDIKILGHFLAEILYGKRGCSGALVARSRERCLFESDAVYAGDSRRWDGVGGCARLPWQRQSRGCAGNGGDGGAPRVAGRMSRCAAMAVLPW